MSTVHKISSFDKNENNFCPSSGMEPRQWVRDLICWSSHLWDIIHQDPRLKPRRALEAAFLKPPTPLNNVLFRWEKITPIDRETESRVSGAGVWCPAAAHHAPQIDSLHLPPGAWLS